ncbi:MAG: hypothetical protein ACPLKP_00515 [Microgenomates group bacterium]
MSNKKKRKSLNFKKEILKLGYRTPDRFRQLIFGKPPIFNRPRSLGGHR